MAGFFGMFDYTKPGKGVSKEDLEKSGIELYFDILLRRFWKMITLNLIYMIFSIPAIVIGWFVSGYGVVALASMGGIEINDATAPALRILSVLVLIIMIHVCGTGPASVAMTGVLKKYVNDTHAWVWSDFVDYFKSNFLQGMGAYIINMIVFCIGTMASILYSRIIPGLLGVFLSSLIFVFLVVFLMMQMYVYQIMSGFKLKIKDIYKNAFILAVAKLPWNVLSAVVSCAFLYGIYMIMSRISMLGEVIAVVILYALITFTQIFMTNNVMKKYLEEPAKMQNPPTEEEEAIFEDK